MEQPNNMRRGNQDRDCLLHLIMSFLSTHEAVRMCVLSKRWKNLWATLPFLNFDLDEFSDLSNWHNISEGERDGYCRMFRNFVSMTLLLREVTDLLKFRLSCSDIPNGRYNRFISAWIGYALKHNSQVLDINICREDSLPLGLFNCASLVDLSLLFPFVRPSLLINLPCIKQLHLQHLNLPCIKRLRLKCLYINQEFMKKLLCGCPVLEFLHLQFCHMEFSSIQSQSLKYLKIESQTNHPDGGITMESIDAPNLLSFYYNGCAQYIGNKVLLNMPSLTSAIICMRRCLSHSSYIGKSKILTGISSVISAKLSVFLMKELLENELSNLPNFQNAEELTVNGLCLKCNFNLLASFIEHFPNLKILSLLHTRPNCEVDLHRNQESLKIAPFKCKQLQTVNVEFDDGDENFHWVLKYLQDGTKSLGAKINMTFVSPLPLFYIT